MVQVVKRETSFFVTLPINTPGIDELFLQGLEGDDQFDILGNHPFTAGVHVQAGDPSASDVLNFTAAAPAPAAGVTIDWRLPRSRRPGFGPGELLGR